MNAVAFIVPTGVGATIGGHAGDATPALKLICEAANGPVLTHPNVVNASAINEMPDKAWYVEGSMLDAFLRGLVNLTTPKHNRVLVAVNEPVPMYARNVVAAAEATMGIDARIIGLDPPLVMQGWVDKDGVATGSVKGTCDLIGRVSREAYDALAILTPINVPADVQMTYFRHGGTNPWGGVEAWVSRVVSRDTGKPAAHAPLESDEAKSRDDLLCIAEHERVDPRMAAEAVSANYAHCIIKGLSYSPRLAIRDTEGLHARDVTCLVTPAGLCGTPHKACIDRGVPVIVVDDNQTVFNEDHPDFIHVRNYVEAAGVVSLLQSGVTHRSVLSREAA